MMTMPIYLWRIQEDLNYDGGGIKKLSSSYVQHQNVVVVQESVTSSDGQG